MSLTPRSRGVLLLGLLLVLVGGAVAAYFLWPQPEKSVAQLPQPASKVYREYQRAFQVGTAALDGTVYSTGRPTLAHAIELIPEEPAAWANRGLLSIRQGGPGSLDEAAKDLQKAKD